MLPKTAVIRAGGKQAEVLFSRPSGGALECSNTHRRGEDRPQIPNVHSVWKRSSSLSRILFVLVPEPAKVTLSFSQT